MMNNGFVIPAIFLAGGIISEIINYKTKKNVAKLLCWFFRPWMVWAVLSIIYQLNSARGMMAVPTAPSFTDNLYPFFANYWNNTETFRETVLRLIHTPAVWLWGSIVAALAFLLVFLTKKILSTEEISRSKNIGILIILYFTAAALSFSVGSLPDGMLSNDERQGSLLSGWHAHNTVLYAVPFVGSKGHFLRNFKEIQPKLRITIHALSHPPGATLSMYFIGRIVGADGMNIRLESTRIRYATGLILFAALNIFVLFGMGYSLFGNKKTGLMAAILWMVMPSVLAYSIFAQDSLYAVFYNSSLLLIWKVCIAEKKSYINMVLLGIIFSCLNFLNYSWGLITTIFVIFLVYNALIKKWRFNELMIRGAIPLGVMTVISGFILLDYKLDYLNAYKVSNEYVRQWYCFSTGYQHIIAWIGGQIDLWLMMGAVTCSAFFGAIITGIKHIAAQNIREGYNHSSGIGKNMPEVLRNTPQYVFILIILGVYILPILFGPTCIRLETARCWMWVLSVPVCFAADFLLRQKRPFIFVTTAMLVSLGTYSIMRLFLNFAP